MDKEMMVIDRDMEHYIACELSHDYREDLGDRVRWNNEAMLRAINTITELRQKLHDAENRIKELENPPWPKLVKPIVALAENEDAKMLLRMQLITEKMLQTEREKNQELEGLIKGMADEE